MIPASVVALAGGAPPRLFCIRACQEPLSGATLAAAWRARIEDGASRSVL